jgi:hypothetical protein
MGYVRKPRVFKITWEDGTELAGLEIRAHSVPMGQFLEFQGYAEELDKGDPVATRALLEMFAGVLVSWNLEVETVVNGQTIAQPVPATIDGLLSQDLEFVLAVVDKWMSAAAGVPDDLGKESTSGVQFPEGSIPMDIPSLDLEQLIAQS